MCYGGTNFSAASVKVLNLVLKMVVWASCSCLAVQFWVRVLTTLVPLFPPLWQKDALDGTRQCCLDEMVQRLSGSLASLNCGNYCYNEESTDPSSAVWVADVESTTQAGEYPAQGCIADVAALDA